MDIFNGESLNISISKSTEVEILEVMKNRTNLYISTSSFYYTLFITDFFEREENRFTCFLNSLSNLINIILTDANILYPN